MIAQGFMLGNDQPVELRLLDMLVSFIAAAVIAIHSGIT
jgi:hypothetical protein